MGLPDTPVSKLPTATLPLSGNEYAILNQNGLTCVAPIGYFPPLTVISVNGDVSGSGAAGNLTLTLPTINNNVGTFNSLTVNGKGQVTGATNVQTVITGDVSGSGIGPITVTINNNAVVNGYLAQVAAGTYKGNPTAASANPSDNVLPPFGECQLQLSSSTQVVLMPYNGRQVTFPNGFIYSISSAGLLSGSVNGGCNLDGVANSTLAANTLYYCYLWYNGGAPVIDFSLTGHSVDASTGIVTKSTDAARVLIGMVYPQTGPALVDSTAARLVASWFNRQSKGITNKFTNNRSISSSSVNEINSEVRGLFLSWGDSVQISANQSCASNTLNSTITSAIGMDGTATIVSSVITTETVVNAYAAMPCAGNYSPSEGLHYITIGGSVSSGTGTWFNGGTLQARMML